MEIFCDTKINELKHDMVLNLQVIIIIQRIFENVHINNQTILHFVNLQ